MAIDYPQQFATYKGIKFVNAGFTNDALSIVTNDATVAAELGFEPADVWNGQFHFKKWVPYTEVERWVTLNAVGTYQGERVEVGRLDDTTCFIDADWAAPGLQQMDRNLWQGTVPRNLVTDITIEETEEDLRLWRRRKRTT